MAKDPRDRNNVRAVQRALEALGLKPGDRLMVMRDGQPTALDPFEEAPEADDEE